MQKVNTHSGIPKISGTAHVYNHVIQNLSGEAGLSLQKAYANTKTCLFLRGHKTPLVCQDFNMIILQGNHKTGKDCSTHLPPRLGTRLCS